MGIVDKLKQEFDLSVERLCFAIHLNTPQEGMLLSTMFPQLDAQNMFRHLREMAAPHGIIFADIARISNSRMSLEALEFAKEHGRFDQFHRALFRTYFSKGIEIGNLEVLACTGHDAGLDRDALVQARQSRKFQPMIETMREKRRPAWMLPPRRPSSLRAKSAFAERSPLRYLEKNFAGINYGAGITVQRARVRLSAGC
jgi:predicted DsbA family dithiol-disulfide isomerase